ncbi:MAG: hypothetical protein AB7N76_12670 [Planctomycetota bacterium]
MTLPTLWLVHPNPRESLFATFLAPRVAAETKLTLFAARMEPGGAWQSQINPLRDGVNPGEDLQILSTKCLGPDYRVAPAQLAAGCYHPRIWRPGGPSPFADQGGGVLQEVFLTSCSAVLGLLGYLTELFRALEPVPHNAGAYGHKTRELLLLACMEVESAWSGVLRANGYPGDRWSTNQYVKLLEPMRLSEYQVQLALHPRWPAVRPFEGWNDQQPTESLPWYHAYNKTKHGRELHFELATLEATIQALAAAFVMVIAQFGPDAFGSPGSHVKGSEFVLIGKPTNFAPDQVYVPVPGHVARTEVPLWH